MSQIFSLEQVAANKDTDAAVRLISSNFDLAVSDKWLFLELLKLICSEGRFDEIEESTQSLLAYHSEFLPVLGEVMYNSAVRETIWAAARKILQRIESDDGFVKKRQPDWVVKLFADAVLIAAPLNFVDSKCFSIFYEHSEKIGSLISALLRFVCNHEVLYREYCTKFENSEPAGLDQPPQQWIIGVGLQSLTSLEVAEGAYVVDFNYLPSCDPDLINDFYFRGVLRALSVRFGNESSLCEDRGVYSIAANQSVSNRGSLALFVGMYLQILRLRRGESIKSLSSVCVKKSLETPFLNHRKDKSFVRGGSVELAFIQCFLEDPIESISATERAVHDLSVAKGNGEEFEIMAPFRRFGNSPYEAILRMSLQAGWYSTPDNCVGDIQNWVDQYLIAFSRHRILEAANEFFFPILGHPRFHPIGLPVRFSESGFYEMLDGRRVLFVSSFAPEVSDYFNSGSLDQLWSEVSIPSRVRSVSPVLAPFSIWPNCPGSGWTETFEELVKSCQYMISKEKCDLLLVAAGVYGAPLVSRICEDNPGISALH
jgi:hypothetical protein